MNLRHLNNLSQEEAYTQFLKVCGSEKWASQMASLRPFKDIDVMRESASEVWRRMNPSDWMQAFAAHPKIGEAANSEWSKQEQSKLGAANAHTTAALKLANETYLKKFGYIFIIFATGKTAEEILSALNLRLLNSPKGELTIACEEQLKIIHLRLEKMVQL